MKIQNMLLILLVTLSIPLCAWHGGWGWRGGWGWGPGLGLGLGLGVLGSRYWGPGYYGYPYYGGYYRPRVVVAPQPVVVQQPVVVRQPVVVEQPYTQQPVVRAVAPNRQTRRLQRVKTTTEYPEELEQTDEGTASVE